MCGIIGYIGFRDSKEVLLKGLKKIQYRGYDSMGLVIASEKGFKRIRSVGDVRQLQNKVAEQKDCSGSWGLGHSRWATHGAPSEENAHPHKAEHIYVVHNGIIENAEELKAWLKGPFLSETDSEVVAHCLLDSYKRKGSLKEAIFDTVSKIKGEYAIAVMSEKYPNELFAFKKGPSLLIGLGEKELFLSSDVQVFLPYTRKVIFLQDGEVAHIKGESEFSCYSENGEKIEKRITVLDAKSEETDKEGYPYYMLKEIYEQPDCILKVIGEHIKKEQVKININKGSGILDQVIRQKRLNIVACGSSYYAALYGKYVIERFSRVFVEVDMASEFRYRFPILSDRVPVLLISQSGETADTLAVMKMFQELSLPVLSLCNVAHSSLDRGASANMYMLAGVEKGVASTKAFTSTLVTLFLLALDLGRKNGQLKSSDEKQLLHSLLSLPDQMEKILARTQEYVDASHLVRALKSFIYLGRDIYYPLALEGALKMKELTYRHAAAYPAGEMKHGPLALVDGDMAIVGLTPQSHVYKKTLSNLEEARSRGGKLILIGTKGDERASSLSEYFLSIPACNEYLSSILCVLPLQLMAYHTACALGHNVDQPRNLAKSVTVE